MSDGKAEAPWTTVHSALQLYNHVFPVSRNWLKLNLTRIWAPIDFFYFAADPKLDTKVVIIKTHAESFPELNLELLAKSVLDYGFSKLQVYLAYAQVAYRI